MVIEWDNFHRITLKHLPENRFCSKAKMYRYHQIEGMVTPDDTISPSWFRPFFGLRRTCWPIFTAKAYRRRKWLPIGGLIFYETIIVARTKKRTWDRNNIYTAECGRPAQGVCGGSKDWSAWPDFSELLRSGPVGGDKGWKIGWHSSQAPWPAPACSDVCQSVRRADSDHF